MKPDNFFSKAAKSVLFFLCLAVSASQAYAEVKIDSVSQTVGVMGKNMEITLTGTGFDENTKVMMMPDYSNRKAIIGSVDTPNFTLSVFISGNYAYMTAQDGGLYIIDVIDVSNPKNPKIIGAVDTPDYARSVAINDKAYVADEESGLQIIDVSSPESPRLIGNSVDTPGVAYGVTVSGNYAYIAWGNDVMTGKGGLQIIDVSNLESPRIIGDGVDTPGFAYGVTVSGNYAYVVMGRSGLHIIDVSDPESPILIGDGVDTPGYASGVTVSSSYAYVADGDNGLRIFQIPTEIKPIAYKDAQHISVILPTPEIAGNYSLFAYHTDTDEKVYEFAGAVEFVQPENAGILKSKAIIVAGGGATAQITISGKKRKNMLILHTKPCVIRAIPKTISCI